MSFEEKLTKEIKAVDLEIIKAVGNGSKWPMVGYYYGVISKLLKVLGKRKIDFAPGYNFLKSMSSEMSILPMFWTTRKCQGKDCDNTIHELGCKLCSDCCGGYYIDA